MNEYTVGWQRANHKKYIASACVRWKRNRGKLREKIRDIARFEKQIPCKDCGKSYPFYVMDFDHLPEKEKSFNISRTREYNSIIKLRKEIAKCDVVCSNCHRERTYRRRFQLDTGIPKKIPVSA